MAVLEEETVTSQQPESLITEEMRAAIGREGPPVRYELDKTAIRMFARAVGHTDAIFYDEDYARSKGHRSLVAPPSYLGTPVFSARSGGGGFTGPGMGPGGRPWRALNGGSEFEYTGVDICAGDVLTAVTKTINIRETRGSLGPMLITQRETLYTNQNGEVVCRAVSTGLQY
jgi:hypothetical protein